MDAKEYLIEVSQQLSLARTAEEVAAIARVAARKICGADGATFILKDGEFCHYLDEDAIGPLWKGRRFPLDACISGWSIRTGGTAVIEDIYQDRRIPHDAYRPTFVKSLVMVPIREKDPIGAIGNYWSRNFKADEESVRHLRSLANLVSIAMENARLVQDLELSLKARDEFLSIASHELKTPLSSLKLQLQLLARNISSNTVPTTADLKEATEVSLRQVGNLTAFVENLLDVSRILMHNIALEYSEFDLGELIGEILQQKLAPLARDMKCEISSELEKNVRGEWDRTRIEQIVSNLVSNACKYAPGKPVHVQLNKSGHSAVITIVDQGPGIRSENHTRIFERFERETSSQHISGFGLGLWMTKKFVEAHWGQITLKSAEGLGTSFTVQLPLGRR